MTTIAGIDPSLTRTGVAVITTDPHTDHPITVTSFTSTPRPTPTISDRLDRLDRISGLVVAVIGRACDADLAVIEGPAYGSRTGNQHDRSGLWWDIVRALTDEYGVPVIEVPPMIRAMYATGKGNAGKDEVLAATVRRYPDVEITNNDEADALVLALIGWHQRTGSPWADLPATHTRAMAKVHSWLARRSPRPPPTMCVRSGRTTATCDGEDVR